jgi:hypothetical protein
MILKDPYSLFHLSLNKMPGENPESDPHTEWLNVGYWKVRSHISRLFSIMTVVLDRILLSFRRLVKVNDILKKASSSTLMTTTSSRSETDPCSRLSGGGKCSRYVMIGGRMRII